MIISDSVNGLARANQNGMYRVRVGATESNRYHMEHVCLYMSERILFLSTERMNLGGTAGTHSCPNDLGREFFTL